MATDFRQPGPQITFALPSLSVPIGKVADRNAALASRDALEDRLTDLARRQDRPIVPIAHSMGAQLVMETLRQMAIGGRSINDRPEAVILISPDIDIELRTRGSTSPASTHGLGNR